ncbi:MAG: prepilin-type N-terminal cleavage/methylation domain-containing protein [Nitrospirota bacterium]
MRTRRPGLRHQGGFTLVETVITIVVVGIAFVVLLSFTQSLRSSADPVLVQQAVALSQERLDQIIADRRDTTTPRGFSYATNPANYPAEAPVTGFSAFNRSVAIACFNAALFTGAGTAPAPDCSASNYARVTVTVTSSGSGSLNVVTLLGNY